MSIFKKYRGRKITAKDKDWSKGTWYVWKRLNGRIIHRAIPEAQNKQQAEAAERAIINERYNKRYGGADNTTFVDFGRGRYSRYCEHQNANIGAKRLYIEILCEAFKGNALSEITPQDCRDVQAKLRKGTISDSSVNRIMSTASRLFSLACEEGILDRNPMQYVRPLKEPVSRDRLLTDKEKENLWSQLHTEPLMFRLVLLATNLPLRRGQILAITPDAVDLPNGLLSVVSSKGRASRVVPLNTTARDTLRQMIADHQIPFPLKDFRKRWKRILVSAGINKPDGKRGENFTFHDLRREMATSLRRQGVHSELIQKLYAHSSMDITRVYLSESMGELSEAVNRLDATNLQPTIENDGPPN